MRLNHHICGLIVLSLITLTAAVVHAERNGKMIAVGEPFVDFELEAHDGTRVSSADLEGNPYLLFFYPKADTPG
jgi:cytochrome oxidase Cu insertion factor (SCO1/SenC/PrrC family)